MFECDSKEQCEEWMDSIIKARYNFLFSVSLCMCRHSLSSYFCTNATTVSSNMTCIAQIPADFQLHDIIIFVMG